jgi:hypothetical protein
VHESPNEEKDIMKTTAIIVMALAALFLTGCVMKRTVTDEKGGTKEKYIIKRPLKEFIKDVESE